ncbi:MAG: hypothetical protein EOQ92_25130 [Mesorhizobium sp.]|uniref:hypothetical protein n=1 Tax=Mesorhizobium sp. TaxID=1871066 RepID=UPI000FE8194B|nr:hypothetical protein [Mesorhizobium sp.]RWI16829.1 MAG: hypothetical protein EOQ92_25130 [Mesorhizobium sp.]RWK44854.1 MAG: hypothetical protein EOR47_33665 [Mesorhizobium sp.]RWK98239.1 MAG: hypothetical protein EOR53_00705 [Mesorhizobium sp.]TIP53301.1 MAG: hypothetical protein E5X56_33395 [Mesorhizobium sp.]TIQ00918.1 MAG: hypothetical protein E5X60_02610 [Mesorhizobium sp.]
MVDIKGYDSAPIPASSYVAGSSQFIEKFLLFFPLISAMPNKLSSRIIFLAVQPAVSTDCADV